jgi:anti-sigma B factor antagonist
MKNKFHILLSGGNNTLNIQTKKTDDALSVSLEGRLDTTTAPQLEATLKKELGSVKALDFDFSALEYLSSAGLRVLLSAQKVMNKQGSMKIHQVSETIMEIFEVTGFTDILTIE